MGSITIEDIPRLVDEAKCEYDDPEWSSTVPEALVMATQALTTLARADERALIDVDIYCSNNGTIIVEWEPISNQVYCTLELGRTQYSMYCRIHDRDESLLGGVHGMMVPEVYVPELANKYILELFQFFLENKQDETSDS